MAASFYLLWIISFNLISHFTKDLYHGHKFQRTRATREYR